jgi:hypothetical protein
MTTGLKRSAGPHEFEGHRGKQSNLYAVSVSIVAGLETLLPSACSQYHCKCG